MSMHRTLTALGFASLCLCACSKDPVPSVAPSPMSTERIVVPAGPDPSLPSAASVLTAAPQASAPTDGRPLGSMSAAEQSSAMPLPGQANGHSAPLATASGAAGK